MEIQVEKISCFSSFTVIFQLIKTYLTSESIIMGTLAKAKLIAQDGGEDIDFMFNPTELDFSRIMNLNASSGARTAQGLPKVSFGSPEPYRLSLSNITFDTYETAQNVLEQYINRIRNSVEFITGKERPPIYILTWGKQKYLRCFVQNLSYKLTMFLSDGTPVRAVVNLTLQEVDETTGNGGSANGSRTTDTRASRS
jgi:hypothetical protein